MIKSFFSSSHLMSKEMLRLVKSSLFSKNKLFKVSKEIVEIKVQINIEFLKEIKSLLISESEPAMEIRFKEEKTSKNPQDIFFHSNFKILEGKIFFQESIHASPLQMNIFSSSSKNKSISPHPSPPSKKTLDHFRGNEPQIKPSKNKAKLEIKSQFPLCLFISIISQKKNIIGKIK